jgi:formiminoglutamase
MSSWKPVDSQLFYSRKDTSDPRLGDIARKYSSNESLPERALVIAGYPDEEGVKLSQGRVGAAAAPSVIRKYFYKMTPPLFGERPVLYDQGDLDVAGDLGRKHQAVRESVGSVLKKGGRWIGLGGGHDFGFADGAGFLDVFGGEKPLIINFDAHLDVRPSPTARRI